MIVSVQINDTQIESVNNAFVTFGRATFYLPDRLSDMH